MVHVKQKLVIPGVGTFDFEKVYQVSIGKNHITFTDSRKSIRLYGSNWTFADIEEKTEEKEKEVE